MFARRFAVLVIVAATCAAAAGDELYAIRGNRLGPAEVVRLRGSERETVVSLPVDMRVVATDRGRLRLILEPYGSDRRLWIAGLRDASLIQTAIDLTGSYATFYDVTRDRLIVWNGEELAAIEVATGIRTSIMPLPGALHPLELDAATQRIYAIGSGANDLLFAADLTTRTTTELLRVRRFTARLFADGGGRLVAYTSPHDPLLPELYSIDLASGTTRTILDPVRFNHGTPMAFDAVSQRLLLYAGFDPNAPVINALDVRTGDVVPLAQLGSELHDLVVIAAERRRPAGR